jgi:F-type H+-transporting ATPase subunit epsilon
LLSSLKPGLLIVRFEGQEQVFTVTGGIIEVQPDQIIVLADAAENVMEIDVTRAEQARQRAEELLKQGPPPDTDTFLAIEAALKRSSLRLDAAKRYRGQRTNFPGRSDNMREDNTK